VTTVVAEEAHGSSWPGRLMAMVLIVLGLGTGVYAFHIRTQIERYSDVRTTQSGKAAPGTASEVITRRATSDSTMIALLVVAVALVLGGAFYRRVQRISIGANSIELYPAAASVEERAALASAVAAAVEERLRSDPVPAEPRELVELAARTASATAIAQQQAEAYLALANASTARSRSSDDQREAARARRGMPMSNDLLEQLARQAVELTFASEPSTDEANGDAEKAGEDA
jgi:hypothetical protein